MRATVIISRGMGAAEQWDLESTLAGMCGATPGLSVLLIPHLYHLPLDSPLWEKLAALPGRLILASWLYPRPAQWVMRSHQVGARYLGAEGGLVALNLADFPTAPEAHAAILAALDTLGAGDAALSEPAEPGSFTELTEPIATRWYPVIDVSLCRNCQQCLQFCLFGVYELDAENQLAATRPDQCKPGCPACSRICPEGAIIFPLYAKDEAIAGAPGTRVAPDAAARKMFYTRTGRPCPVCGSCGSTKTSPGAGAAGVCEECGRSMISAAADEQPADPASPQTIQSSLAPVVRDDIDSLLDDLDSLSRGGR